MKWNPEIILELNTKRQQQKKIVAINDYLAYKNKKQIDGITSCSKYVRIWFAKNRNDFIRNKNPKEKEIAE